VVRVFIMMDRRHNSDAPFQFALWCDHAEPRAPVLLLDDHPAWLWIPGVVQMQVPSSECNWHLDDAEVEL
jgi:hypothetical protein